MLHPLSLIACKKSSKFRLNGFRALLFLVKNEQRGATPYRASHGKMLMQGPNQIYYHLISLSTFSQDFQHKQCPYDDCKWYSFSWQSLINKRDSDFCIVSTKQRRKLKSHNCNLETHSHDVMKFWHIPFERCPGTVAVSQPCCRICVRPETCWVICYICHIYIYIFIWYNSRHLCYFLS